MVSCAWVYRVEHERLQGTLECRSSNFQSRLGRPLLFYWFFFRLRFIKANKVFIGRNSTLIRGNMYSTAPKCQFWLGSSFEQLLRRYEISSHQKKKWLKTHYYTLAQQQLYTQTHTHTHTDTQTHTQTHTYWGGPKKPPQNFVLCKIKTVSATAIDSKVYALQKHAKTNHEIRNITINDHYGVRFYSTNL